MWVVRDRIVLPERVRAQMHDEDVWKQWKRRFYTAAGCALAVVVLSNVALYVCSHYGQRWATLPMAVALVPVLWLMDKAVFSPIRQPRSKPVMSDIPELVSTHTLADLIIP